jgi:hypothetical protein
VVSIASSALYITSDPTIIILIIIFNGILRGAPNPLLTTLVGETPGTKPEYMGTSIGLLNTIGLMGGVHHAARGQRLCRHGSRAALRLLGRYNRCAGLYTAVYKDEVGSLIRQQACRRLP